jgi:protein phosphatase
MPPSYCRIARQFADFDLACYGGNLLHKDKIQFVGLSDTGQVRERNEDSVALSPQLGLVVLADGMGGQSGGAVASNMATSAIVTGLTACWTADALKGLDRAAAIELAQSVLRDQIKSANLAIYDAAQESPEYSEMGTTLVACLLHDDFMTVAHLGDSRLYRLRNDLLEQITRDHSLLQEQIDSGMISKEDAHLSNNKNLLTRALGIDPDEEAEIHSYDTADGDLYLLCSDGLHGMLPDDEIEMTLGALKENPELLAQQLIQAANDAGGTDNVSVILLRLANNLASE